MNKKVKKLLSCLAISTCMITTGLVAFANTTGFYITTERGVTDKTAQKTYKSGGTSYDNYAYVRANTVAGSGSMNVWCQNINNSSIKSGSMELCSQNLHSLEISRYSQTAPANQEYALHGSYITSVGGQPIGFTGDFTP